MKGQFFYDAANYFHLGLGHLWSLAIEEHFYMAWPLLVYLCSRRGVVGLCGVLMAGALACRIGLMAAGCDGLGLPYQFTLCRVDALAVGAMLAGAGRGGPGGLAGLVRPAKWVFGTGGVGAGGDGGGEWVAAGGWVDGDGGV